MTLKGILIFITTLLLFACTNNDSQDNTYFNSTSTAKFVKDADTTNPYYTIAKDWEKQLQLTSIENGLQGFEMRLYYNPEIVLNKKLITVKYLNQTWTAKAYLIKTNLDERISPVIDSVEIEPKSGWKNFQNELLKLQVKQLPNHSSFQGDMSIDDGITYFAEVANQGFYRFTWFSNPQPNVSNNKSAQQWQSIVELFKMEFNLSF